MERIIIQMDSDRLAEVDEAAREKRQSRAAFVRSALEAALAERQRRKELDQVVESYRANPPEDLTAPKEVLRAVWPE